VEPPAGGRPPACDAVGSVQKYVCWSERWRTKCTTGAVAMTGAESSAAAGAASAPNAETLFPSLRPYPEFFQATVKWAKAFTDTSELPPPLYSWCQTMERPTGDFGNIFSESDACVK